MKLNKSSVEWLADRFDAIIELYPSERQLINDAIKQAKAMHKEEIIKSWMAVNNELQRIAAEKYYNETFGNEND